MTACLYFSPMNIPALFADSLVTSNAMSPAFPSPGNSISNSKDVHRVNAVALVRKIQFINDRIALAAAGEEVAIKSYFETAEDAAKTDPERPTRALADHIEAWRGRLNVIGAYVPGSEPKDIFHIRPCSIKPINSPKLGTYFAIGSGADVLLKYAHYYNDSILHRDPRIYLEHPYEIIREIGENIGADILNQESLGGDLVSKTWGGFSEYAYFDWQSQRWCYGPPRANFFYDCFILPSGRIVCLLSSRAVFYKPGLYSSYVCTVTRGLDRANINEWILEGIVKRGVYEKEFSDRWRDWKPTSANFCFNLYNDKKFRRACFCNELYDQDKFFATISEGSFSWGLNEDYFEKISNKVCRNWGRHPVAPKDLTESDKAYLSNYTTLV